MKYVLFISACMSTSPSVCTTDRVSIEGALDISGAGCMMSAPTLIELWKDDHQNEWVVVDWKCSNDR